MKSPSSAFRRPSESPFDRVVLGVNGTLMRGLELNGNLLEASGEFVEETRTAPCYRLWSIGDRHPGMIRCSEGGASIELELWRLPAMGLAQVLLKEPPGLTMGKILLIDGREVLGVLAEPWLCEGQPEITRHGGWRAYRAQTFSGNENPGSGSDAASRG
jgi:hypothetical protein